MHELNVMMHFEIHELANDNPKINEKTSHHFNNIHYNIENKNGKIEFIL